MQRPMQVHDQGRALTVVYSGGTEFNFENDVAHFDQYLASERKLASLAAAAGATVIINNQSQFNGAADKLRVLAEEGSAIGRFCCKSRLRLVDTHQSFG
jgi:hypothetical protein